MRVDAASVPASTILALVATLGLVALLICLVRVCAAGRAGWRSMRGLRAEEGVVLFAAACGLVDVVVTVVVQSQRRGRSDDTAGEEVVKSNLLWADSLLQIIGLGLVKIAVALMVFRFAARTWLRSTAVGYICTTTVLTIFWFGSSLLLDGPITLSWDTNGGPHAAARLLASINSTLDLLTTVAATLLPLPLLWTLHPSTSTKSTLLPAYALATAAIAAASLRTYLVHSTRLTHGPSTTYLTTLASSIELSTGLTAALLPNVLSSLFPSTSSFSQITNYVPHFTTKPPPSTAGTATLSKNDSAPRYHSFRSNSSRYTYGSTSTVLRHSTATNKNTNRGSGAVAGRYHDNESNVEFELLTPTRARSRVGAGGSYPQSLRSHPRSAGSYPQSLRSYPQSLRSYPQSLHEVPLPQLDRQLHHQSQRQSRTASVWNEKEGLFVASPRRSAAVSVENLESRTRAICGDGVRESKIGIALTTLCAAPQIARLSLRGDERDGDDIGDGEGEELAELRKLFEDREVQWGVLDGSPEENGARLGRYRGVRI